MTVVLFSIVLTELFIVAGVDLKIKKISNLWILLNILLAFSFYIFSPDTHSLQIEQIYYPLGFIVIGFILFSLDIMGAGDSKYMASLFLILPYNLHSLFFEKLLLVTMTVGFFLLLYRVIVNRKEFKAYLMSRHWKGIQALIKSRFSYAPVILLAWILMGVEQWR